MKKNPRKSSKTASQQQNPQNKQSKRQDQASDNKKTLQSIALIGSAFIAAIVIAVVAAFWTAPPGPVDLPAAEIEIAYPLDGAMFPPDIASPTFLWTDTSTAPNRRWKLRLAFSDGSQDLEFTSASPQWQPTENDWATIKQRSVEQPLEMTIQSDDAQQTTASVSFSTSRDEVGAPIFYREVNLPFSEAIKDPSQHVRWRFGSISTPEQPPVVLDKLLVCGNCHSFSADGSLFGMDVDYASDKGSYAIGRVEEEIELSDDLIITWSDYKKEDGKKTFGLLSQVSPDGRYVVSTVKDLSVFHAVDNLAFSQLFFPIQGILCIYDRETKQYAALPGADDPKYVQSNATWSPDGKYIVFARSESYEVDFTPVNELGLTKEEEMSEFLSGKIIFKYDLYRVPFNNGKGGKAEPIVGASNNGRSNYFAKYSPDGRWIVFCQANGFMLLQEDSQLYIIPAEGGEARRLECNTDCMNSWHSWSPNSRWLVFSSKKNTPYTQLMLTHIDEQGHSTPPVVLDRFTLPTKAGNIPEFVNTQPDAIKIFRKNFVGYIEHVKRGDELAKAGKNEEAIVEFKQALALNPESNAAHRLWGVLLISESEYVEAEKHLRLATESQPDDERGIWNLGKVLELQERYDESIETYRKAIEVNPNFVQSHYDLGHLLLKLGRREEAIKELTTAAVLDQDSVELCCELAEVYQADRNWDDAIKAYTLALQRDPNSVHALSHLAAVLIADPESEQYDSRRAMKLAQQANVLSGYQAPETLITLSDVFAANGDKQNAISSGETALQLAENDPEMKELADTIRKKIEGYKAM